MIADKEARALIGRLVAALEPFDRHHLTHLGGIAPPDDEHTGVGFSHAEAREAKAARMAGRDALNGGVDDPYSPPNQG